MGDSRLAAANDLEIFAGATIVSAAAGLAGYGLALGGTAAVLAGARAAGVGVGTYFALQAGAATFETAVETGLSGYFGGNVSFGGTAATFGKNFAVNSLTGGFGGATKLGKVAAYLGRQGIEISADTAFDVANGYDFTTSLLINAAGSVGGELLGLAARRAGRYLMAISQTAGALPVLPGEYHYRSVGGRSVVVRNPGRAADLPQLHLNGNRLVQGTPPRTTGGFWNWANVRQRLGSSGWAVSGQDVHHWLIPRSGWGRSVPDVVKNQKWNLMRMPSRAEHFRVHGWSFDGQPGYNLPTRLWRGTPTPAKLSVGGGVIVIGAGYYYFSE